MGNADLKEAVELLRLEMVQLALEKGLNHKDVIRISQELDVHMLQLQKQKMETRRLC